MSPTSLARFEAALGAALDFTGTLNRHDVAGMMRLLTDDCVFEDSHPPPNGATYSGKGAIARFWQDVFHRSPDASVDIEEAFGFARQRPYLIGLTGNIATGKSTVARMLAELGATVIDADWVAHEVMRAGTPVHQAVVAAFGPGVLRPDGEIDRARLGGIVFSDPQVLAQLEAIVHPAVGEEVARRIAAAPTPVVVVEAIKLIESEMARVCDALWVTTCPPAEQVRRLMADRGLSRQEAEQRVNAQPPQEEKIALADVVIHTGGTMEETLAQVERWWGEVIRDS